jgi:four helix bundle protein
MKNFRTFILAVDFYKQIQCQKLPSALGNQLERAAQSIALNLAEGRGRNRKADQLRFFHIALGSLRECQAILILANLEDSEVSKTLDSLGAHLCNLIKKAR